MAIPDNSYNLDKVITITKNKVTSVFDKYVKDNKGLITCYFIATISSFVLDALDFII
jgi:hypothetical protein